MSAITRRRFLKLGGIFGVAGLAASYPLLIERYHVLTHFYRVPVPNLPRAFSGLRIVQITDLHYGLLLPLAVVRRVIDRTHRLEPDVIVCTGDYVQGRGRTAEIDTVWPLLAELKAPLGVHSVLGNHDHWADAKRSRHWLNATNQNLSHKAKVLEKDGGRLWLAGAGDLWEDHEDLDRILKGVPDPECRIVLAHNPDTADTKFSARVDLMLAGHTHGGQIDLPLIGAPFLPVRNRTYSRGLKRSPRGVRIFISSGVGCSGYPVRLNCPPEIAVLELVPERNV